MGRQQAVALWWKSKPWWKKFGRKSFPVKNNQKNGISNLYFEHNVITKLSVYTFISLQAIMSPL